MKMAVACTECRSQHLRCDSKKPICSRCADARLSCVYLPSRRGGRRKPRVSRQPSQERPLMSDNSDEAIADRPFIAPIHESSTIPEQPTHPQPEQQAPPEPQSFDPHSLEGDSNPVVSDARLVCLYYENFHLAHPLLVPSRFYESRNYPRYLHQVVKFIGSQYSAVLPNDTFAEATALELNTNVDRTPCMVQALLLYSIILTARNEHHQAEIALAQATDIALELGMYQGDFATTYSNNQEPEAESLRRTWWELFTVEVYIATLKSKVHLRCSEVPYDVALPCEEFLYASQDTIPSPPTLEEFGMRLFLDDDDDNDDVDPAITRSKFSSYSYRIEAVRILARVLVLNSLPETHQDHLQAVTNALVSWVNHLPPHKVDIIDMYGNIDEMIFQAHGTINFASILLHLPRSNLRPKFPDHSQHRVCPVMPNVRLSPSLTRQVHDVIATEASKKLTNILSVRPSVKGHSPFGIFCLVLCGLVQLATAEHHPPTCTDHHYNRVILVLGSLKLLRNNWALARAAHSQLRLAAADTMASSSSGRSIGTSSSSPSANGIPGSWTPRRPASFNVGVGATGSLALDNQLALASPMFLSEFVDPTCGDQFFLDRLSAFAGVS
ncbi:Zn(II)2Cys6 transcription factor [Aspergillus stella-maris]|uniref:Zn(II)2Cys6 transcription factor n=1 Tax=Aspergillus stella-maris TaxID=1810926 RepID=UPI003CCD72CB